MIVVWLPVAVIRTSGTGWESCLIQKHPTKYTPFERDMVYKFTLWKAPSLTPILNDSKKKKFWILQSHRDKKEHVELQKSGEILPKIKCSLFLCMCTWACVCMCLSKIVWVYLGSVSFFWWRSNHFQLLHLAITSIE